MANNKVESGQSAGDNQESLKVDRDYYLWQATEPGGLALDGVLMEIGDATRKQQRVLAILSLVQDRLMEVSTTEPPMLTLTELGQEKFDEMGVEPRSAGNLSYRSPQ